MKFGGPVFGTFNNPDQWIQKLKEKGFTAAYSPVEIEITDVSIIKGYREAAEKNGITIAEVGAWSNPLSPIPSEKKEALEKCKRALWQAEELGANCCINIAGSRGEKWDGPCEKDLTEETFEMIVESVRDIIDDVKPKKTYYCLETMPWMYPNSTESYLNLIRAIDRPAFAVHFDPVNLINSPTNYFSNKEIINEFIQKLGPYIKSCHAKDIILGNKLTTYLHEVRPGKGNLDYKIFLSKIDRLNKEIPVMLEHLPDEKEYDRAAEHIRMVAAGQGIMI